MLETSAVIKFDSPVALIFTPEVNLLLYGWIVSTTGQFSCNIKGLSIILSRKWRYGLQPLLTALSNIPALLSSHFHMYHILKWIVTPMEYYLIILLFYLQDRVYVQQNGVDNVYNLGLILFRDLVSYSWKFVNFISHLIVTVWIFPLMCLYFWPKAFTCRSWPCCC